MLPLPWQYSLLGYSIWMRSWNKFKQLVLNYAKCELFLCSHFVSFLLHQLLAMTPSIATDVCTGSSRQEINQNVDSLTGQIIQEKFYIQLRFQSWVCSHIKPIFQTTLQHSHWLYLCVVLINWNWWEITGEGQGQRLRTCGIWLHGHVPSNKEPHLCPRKGEWIPQNHYQSSP